jgi:hypothetical protein
VYEKKGDYDRAIAEYSKAIKIALDNGVYDIGQAEIYYDRGVAYTKIGDEAKALADFETVMQLSSNPKIPADVEPKAELRDKAQARIGDLEKHLAAAAPAAVAPAPPARTDGSRVALVIGNSAYRHVPSLNNPVNDASLIAKALKADGFDVTVADNLDRDGLIDALKTFATKADNADWAVIYFAGHGIEMGGTNYLIPVDAKLATDRDVGFEAIPIDQVMSAVDGAHQLRRVVILDACRNNPFAATLKRTAGEGRDIGRGLARIEQTRGTVIEYSARDGTIAADGRGADSPFATALAQHLTEAGIDVDKMFRLVRDDVLDATGNKQEPFMYGSLPGHRNIVRDCLLVRCSVR